MTSEVPADGSDHLSQLIRGSWADVLGHAEFSDDDYFFSIGGSSLAAIKAMRNIGQLVGSQLPVRLIFMNQTITLLAAAVRETLAAVVEPAEPEAAVAGTAGSQTQ